MKEGDHFKSKNMSNAPECGKIASTSFKTFWGDPQDPQKHVPPTHSAADL